MGQARSLDLTRPCLSLLCMTCSEGEGTTAERCAEGRAHSVPFLQHSLDQVRRSARRLLSYTDPKLDAYESAALVASTSLAPGQQAAAKQ